MAANASRHLRKARYTKLAIFAAGASLTAYVAPGMAFANGASPTAPAYRFTVVATIGDAAPGGGVFPFDFEPSGINDAGTVAFTADVSDALGNNIGEGVFFEKGGTMTQVMRIGQPAPGATAFGSSELGRLGFNSAGDIAVPFSLNGYGPLLTPSGTWRYASATGALTPVAVPGMAMPGGGTYEGMTFNLGMNNKGQIVFPALVTESQVDPGGPGANGMASALFMANRDGTVVSLVRPGDPAPGGRVFDDAWNGLINNAGDIVFGGYVKGDPCLPLSSNPYACGDSVYLRNAATRTITSIAHQGDPAPGGGTFVHAFGGLPNDAGKVVFIGDLSPSGNDQVLGVFAYNNGILSAVARPGDQMPGGGTFVSAADQVQVYGINDNGDIAFAASLNTATGTGNHDTGMYLQSHGSVNLVARTGTVIPGVGTIDYLSQSPPLTQPTYGSGGMINDSGQVLLNATLTNGKGVLLVATPIH
jgi:hypothetical protein